MKRLPLFICLFTALILSCGAFAQSRKMQYDHNDPFPQELLAFATAGYQLFHAQYGDLDANGDTTDVLLLLTDLREPQCDNCAPRVVKVLLREPDGKLGVAKSSGHIVLGCHDGGSGHDDPFLRFVIKKGYFTIEEWGGMGAHGWEAYTTFHFDGQRDWYLSKRAVIYYSDDKQDNAKIRTRKEFGLIAFENFDLSRIMDGE